MVEIDLEPSRELAYIIGAILSDGSISRRDAYITFAVRDEEFMQKFKGNFDTIADENSIKIHKYSYKRTDNYQKYYTLLHFCVYSRRLHNYFLWQEYEPTVKKYPADFLNGFLDGDGTVYITTKLNKCSISFANKNMELINLICKCLQALNIRYFIIRESNGTIRARIRVNPDDMLSFSERVKPSIPRKKAALQQIANMCRDRIAYKEEMHSLKQEIINARLAGLNWGQIGRKLNISTPKAWGYIYSSKGQLWHHIKATPIGARLELINSNQMGITDGSIPTTRSQ